jgi:hypothetical protein
MHLEGGAIPDQLGCLEIGEFKYSRASSANHHLNVDSEEGLRRYRRLPAQQGELYP